MKLLTFTPYTCKSCHRPIPADYNGSITHCPACSERLYQEWKTDTQSWIDTKSVRVTVDGREPTLMHVKTLRELFPKPTKRVKAKPMATEPTIHPTATPEAALGAYDTAVIAALKLRITDLEAELRAWKTLRVTTSAKTGARPLAILA